MWHFYALNPQAFLHKIPCRRICPSTHSFIHLSPVTTSISLPAGSPDTPLPAGLESLQHVLSRPLGLSPVSHAWDTSWGRHLGDIFSKCLNHLHWIHFAMCVCSRCQVKLCVHWEHFLRAPTTFTHCIDFREQSVTNFRQFQEICISFLPQSRGLLKLFQLGKRYSIVVQRHQQPMSALPP